MERQPITQEGYNRLREQIRHLEEVEMPQIAEKIALARAEGDLSENAEYHGQRTEQGLLQAKINQLKYKLSTCYIVDKSAVPKGIAAFGSRVTIRNLASGAESTYEFVGPGEEDYDGDIVKMLTSSPLAKALTGKRAGDVVEFQSPSGMQRLEIVSVDDPE